MAKTKEKTSVLPKNGKKNEKDSGLSKEMVGDSDSEVETSKTTAKADTKKKDIKTSSKSAKAAAPAKKAESSSDEDDTESSSESESEEEKAAPKKAAEKKTNGVKRKAEEKSSSESSSESEESEEEEEKEQPAAKKVKASEATSSSSSEEESEDDTTELPTRPAAKTATPASKTNPLESTVALPYKAPSGYKKASSATLNSSDDFSASSLAQKQIWHITAPSNVSLASISEVTLDAIKSQTPVLKHKGVDYILAEDPVGSDSTTVLLPNKKGYAPVKQSITKSLRLQQKIDLPNLSGRQANTNTGGAAAADVSRAAVSTVRPQPKGLRMRYKPAGFGEGKLGQIGSDSESEAEQGSSFQFPRTMGGGHGESEVPPATKKSKKSKKEKHADEDIVMADAESPEKLSKEEKAKRKEEKRLKKEKKAKS